MDSTFDFLIGDLAPVPANTDSNSKENNPVIRKDPIASAPLIGLDWLLDSDNVSAPHPDAFDLELDALVASGNLDSLVTTTFDNNSFNNNPPAIDFGLYRSPLHSTYSAYSGYSGYALTTSETLSAYGSAYEPSSLYDQISERGGQTAQAQTPSSAKLATSSTSSNSGPQQQHLPSSLSSLFPDIDLNFTAFNIVGSTDNSHTNTAPSSISLDSVTAAMLPRRNSSRSAADALNGQGSSYDPSTNGYDGGDYYLPSTANVVPPNYSTHPSLSNRHVGLGLTGTQQSGNASARSISNADGGASSTTGAQSEHDPRKKYQCPTCPRAFARAFNLKTHMATHDPHRVKNFVCKHSGCGRSFSRKHDLGRHLVSIHQDTTGVGSTSTSPTAGSSSKRISPGSIGVAASDKERVWCESCGRGWLVGSRETCDCVKEE